MPMASTRMAVQRTAPHDYAEEKRAAMDAWADHVEPLVYSVSHKLTKFWRKSQDDPNLRLLKQSNSPYCVSGAGTNP